MKSNVFISVNIIITNTELDLWKLFLTLTVCSADVIRIKVSNIYIVL